MSCSQAPRTGAEGKLYALDVSRFDGALGGGSDYRSPRAWALSFRPLADKVILGLRSEVSGVEGRPPFFDNPGTIYNFGLGGRCKVFDAHNMWLGVDIPRGPENCNGYIQVGQPW